MKFLRIIPNVLNLYSKGIKEARKSSYCLISGQCFCCFARPSIAFFAKSSIVSGYNYNICYLYIFHDIKQLHQEKSNYYKVFGPMSTKKDPEELLLLGLLYAIGGWPAMQN